MRRSFRNFILGVPCPNAATTLITLAGFQVNPVRQDDLIDYIDISAQVKDTTPGGAPSGFFIRSALAIFDISNPTTAFDMFRPGRTGDNGFLTGGGAQALFFDPLRLLGTDFQEYGGIPIDAADGGVNLTFNLWLRNESGVACTALADVVVVFETIDLGQIIETGRRFASA